MPDPIEVLYALRDVDDDVETRENWEANRAYGRRLDKVITDDEGREKGLTGRDRVEVFDRTGNLILLVNFGNAESIDFLRSIIQAQVVNQ